MAHVKWLSVITALDAPFTGYQQAVAYRYGNSRDEPGEPVTMMRVRSLMVPPGIPDFLTRMRVVESGLVELTGRAWSGRTAVAKVEVSTNGGKSWALADLDPASNAHPYAWQAWRLNWDAQTAGNFELVCRATDATGAVQPVNQYWTARGMGNNMAQRVGVQVR
jgi:hypothetical protein